MMDLHAYDDAGANVKNGGNNVWIRTARDHPFYLFGSVASEITIRFSGLLKEGTSFPASTVPLFEPIKASWGRAPRQPTVMLARH
jgi:hypothetical protein